MAINVLMGTDSLFSLPSWGFSVHKSESTALQGSSRHFQAPKLVVPKPAGWTEQVFIYNMKAMNNAGIQNVIFFCFWSI